MIVTQQVKRQRQVSSNSNSSSSRSSSSLTNLTSPNVSFTSLYNSRQGSPSSVFSINLDIANVLGTTGGKHNDTNKVQKPRNEKRSESSKRQRINDEADSAKVTEVTPTKTTDLTLTNLTIDMNFEDTSNLRGRRSLTRNNTPEKSVKHLKLTSISPKVVSGTESTNEHYSNVKKNLLISTIEAIEEKVHRNQSTPKKSALKKTISSNQTEDSLKYDTIAG